MLHPQRSTKSRRTIARIAILLFPVILTATVSARATAAEPRNDAAVSKAAFFEVYKVFMSPRCMNCHPDGDAPLQGDDSHVHTMNVRRGEEGKGKYALKCANCHQDMNFPGANMPPGNQNWHLTPADMPMVFQHRTPRQLALQMVDPKQNGGKSLADLYHHVAEDKLVLWGWDPGDGRTKPPLSHEEFARQMKIWLDNGAVAPD